MRYTTDTENGWPSKQEGQKDGVGMEREEKELQREIIDSFCSEECLSMVKYTYNSINRRLRYDDHQFDASLGYTHPISKTTTTMKNNKEKENYHYYKCYYVKN